MKLLITIIICSLIGFYIHNNQTSRHDKIKSNRNIANAEAPKPQVSQTPQASSMDSIIRQTISKVTYDMMHDVDVDSNGDISCIDAAVLFYKYFPDKSKVCIEWNYNPKKDFNHMFNCVLINESWRAIEPQMLMFLRDTYWMADIWGDRYDSRLNKDVTARWEHLAK